MANATSDSQSIGEFFKGGDSTEASAIAYYDRRADDYDRSAYDQCRYKGPHVAVQTLARHVTDKNALILCSAAGTGLEGELLHALGYARLHAQDGSAHMMDKCRRRGVFQQHIVQIFYTDKQCAIDSDTYDAVLSVGAFIPQCLSEHHLPEVLRLVKRGGVLVLATMEQYVRPLPQYNWNYDLQARIERMEEEGLVEIVERIAVEAYSYGNGPGMEQDVPQTGIVYIIRKK